MTGVTHRAQGETCEEYLQRQVSVLAGMKGGIASRRSVAGGCINNGEILSLTNDRRIFVKRNRSSFSGLFAAEAAGLAALKKARGPRVPEVLGRHDDGKEQILILEFIPSGSRGPRFWDRFAEELAAMHSLSAPEGFGFSMDNHIGATDQPNGWRAGWLEFFAEQRISFQLDLAERRGRIDGGLAKRCRRFIAGIPDILIEPEASSLIHGDLWGGNYMVDDAGAPVLIDPAVYFGHREADLAMTELFGGFDSRFYDAYKHAWPLDPGYESRRDAYNLYHMLNHLNLFGGSYAGSVRAILQRYT